MKGYIRFQRDYNESWFYNVRPYDYTHAFLDLMLLANYADREALVDGEIIMCKRGSVYRSQLYLAERWGWDRKKVRRFLDNLEKTNHITLTTSQHGTIITLVNYENLDSYRATDGLMNDALNGIFKEQTTHNETEMIPTQKNTDKKENKGNKDKKEYIAPLEPTEVFIELPLNDGSYYQVSFTEVQQMKELYPNVNVEQEYRNMKGWLIGNPSKKKTRKGIGRFVCNWLSKNQDSNKGGSNTPTPPTKPTGASSGAWSDVKEALDKETMEMHSHVSDEEYKRLSELFN